MNSTDDWVRVRKRNRRYAFLAMLLLTPLASLPYSFVQQFFWQLPAFAWFLLYLTYSFPGILYGVFTTQLVIWWHWQSERTGRWQSGVLLLAAYLIGYCLTSIGWMMYASIRLLPAILICVGYGLAGIATHWFVVMAGRSISPVHIVDLTTTHERSSKSDSNIRLESLNQLGISEEQDLPAPQPKPFSIATLMVATLVSALVLVFLRLTREVYSTSDFASGYPDSDLGQIVRLLSSATANSLSLFAAVHWHRRRSILALFAMILAGLGISLAGRLVGIVSGDPPSTLMDFGSIVALILDSLGMLSLQVWLLKKWHRSGYRFC